MKFHFHFLSFSYFCKCESQFFVRAAKFVVANCSIDLILTMRFSGLDAIPSCNIKVYILQRFRFFPLYCLQGLVLIHGYSTNISLVQLFTYPLLYFLFYGYLSGLITFVVISTSSRIKFSSSMTKDPEHVYLNIRN